LLTTYRGLWPEKAGTILRRPPSNDGGRSVTVRFETVSRSKTWVSSGDLVFRCGIIDGAGTISRCCRRRSTASIAASTVWEILHGAGIDPAAGRTEPTAVPGRPGVRDHRPVAGDQDPPAPPGRPYSSETDGSASG